VRRSDSSHEEVLTVRWNLKFAIVTSGKTQRQLAADGHIPENRLSSIVNGWATPRNEECQRIAELLGRPVDDLFDSSTGSPAAAATEETTK
jgi:transcriptional regulator with XRE-family HTH domain